MRKLPLLLCLLAAVVFAGQVLGPADFGPPATLFSESWDGSGSWNINTPPNGWLINDQIAGGNLGWQRHTFSDGYSAHCAYSPTESDFQFELLMDTLSIDCSGYENVSIAFDFVLDWYTTPGGVFELWVSSDDWSSYEIAVTHDYYDGSVGYFDC
jgi:hypothetical protein